MKPLIIGIWLALGIGCGIAPNSPAVHDFGLPSHTAATPSGIFTDIKVTAPPWLEDHYIHYRLLYSQPTQVRYYTLDSWVAPPAELIAQHFIANGTFTQPLHIRLLGFEQQFDTVWQARAVLQLSVEAYSADHQRLLGSRAIHLQQPTPSPDAQGAVVGLARLTQQAVGQIQDWLATLPAH
jgi:cholesterol transport system auxiliary component